MGRAFSLTCRSWFAYTNLSLPQPLRPDPFTASTIVATAVRYIPRRGRSSAAQLRKFDQLRSPTDPFEKLRDDARQFKNISLTLMRLPDTPVVSNVRRIQIPPEFSIPRLPQLPPASGSSREIEIFARSKLDLLKPATSMAIPKASPFPSDRLKSTKDSDTIGNSAGNTHSYAQNLHSRGGKSNHHEDFASGCFGSPMSIRSEPRWATSLSYGSSFGGLQSPQYGSAYGSGPSHLSHLSSAAYMRDFMCCGELFPTIHDLLTHYEERHSQKTTEAENDGKKWHWKPEDESKAGRDTDIATLSFVDDTAQLQAFTPSLGETECLSNVQEKAESQQSGTRFEETSKPPENTIKPFVCPVVECNKSYKNQNGLR